MAYLTHIRCKNCGEQRQVTIQSGMPEPDLCHECQQEEMDKKRRQYFSGPDVKS